MTDRTLWTLVYLQIAMGAFGTLYHHELTERLAWRPNPGNREPLPTPALQQYPAAGPTPAGYAGSRSR